MMLNPVRRRALRDVVHEPASNAGPSSLCTLGDRNGNADGSQIFFQMRSGLRPTRGLEAASPKVPPYIGPPDAVVAAFAQSAHLLPVKRSECVAPRAILEDPSR